MARHKVQCLQQREDLAWIEWEETLLAAGEADASAQAAALPAAQEILAVWEREEAWTRDRVIEFGMDAEDPGCLPEGE